MKKRKSKHWRLWRFHYRPPSWTDEKFGFPYCPGMLGGILYAGVTVFGHSIIYSDQW